jgi:hypothetical protein
MSYKCKECGSEFKSEKALHAHIKVHKMYVSDYYVKHYPRYNKLNGNPLPFKNKEDYFQNDFINRSQLIKWCETANSKEVKNYIIEIAKNRIKNKKYKNMPPHIELENRQLPGIEIYKKHFGTMTNACEKIGCKALFDKGLTKEFYKDFNEEIIIDTREQKPLTFLKSRILKLDFGDYTLGGDKFSNTFVDRKSASDFLGTFGGGYERFRREMQRCKDVDAFMYIVTEKPLEMVKKELYFQAYKGKRSPKFNWIMSNVIKIQHEFANNCQFIFTENRDQSVKLIPKLLVLGKKIWKTDLQYYIEKQNVLGKGKSKAS